MFSNTGIATYVWVRFNRKPEHRRGKVQLADTTKWSPPLRKNSGKNNCELGEEDIACVSDTFLAFDQAEESKIFDNAAFGYWQVSVQRPLRLEGSDSHAVYKGPEIGDLNQNGKRSDDAPAFIRTIHTRGTDAVPFRELFAATVDGRAVLVQYDPDNHLRDCGSRSCRWPSRCRCRPGRRIRRPRRSVARREDERSEHGENRPSAAQGVNES